jgi:hypothetical protein
VCAFDIQSKSLECRNEMREFLDAHLDATEGQEGNDRRVGLAHLRNVLFFELHEPEINAVNLVNIFR